MDQYRDILAPNEVDGFVPLNNGDSLYSACRSIRLIMQEDGNLVLYVIDDRNIPRDPPLLGQMDPNALAQLSDQNNPNNPYRGALWSSGTNGLGQFAQARFQWDGNLVVYDSNNIAHFSSGTNGNEHAFLRCQDDGNLVIYSQSGVPLWNTRTNVVSHV
jgi:hypothetical protein